jgi:wyosine [tRNA(Phe)-imidazoG37] synthetase (radical SAM superfamily)
LTLERRPYVSFEAVKTELDHYWEHNEDPDYITFSGSGEPTLNQDLGRVIAYIKEHKPGVKVAVLTNSTLLKDPKVRQELALADLVVPSLDAASTTAFNRVNRPVKGVSAQDIVQGIQAFALGFTGKIWLEIFILPGVNDTREELDALRQIILSIDPEMVQLNTLDRPGTVSHIRPATPGELARVKTILNMDIIQIIARVPEKKNSGRQRDMTAAVIETIHRRPCTREDLVAILSADPHQIDTLLAGLEAEGRIEARQQARGVFYQTVK